MKLLAVLLLTVTFRITALAYTDPADGTVLPNAHEIFSRLQKANAIRARRLPSYSSIRSYSVYQKDKPSDAEIKVRMEYVGPSTKNFRILSWSGSGWIQRWVFRSLIRAEQETAGGKSKADGEITSANYEVKWIGEEPRQGHECYLLELHPRRRDKFLVDGKIWVDKQDFAIVTLEGEPAKSLSFWVVRAHLVREYQKVGDFWLQLKDETNAEIRLAGEYVMKINYGDYQLTNEGPRLSSERPAESDDLPPNH